jgi:hypothetical protein
MPTYYINIRDHGKLIRDLEGIKVESLDAAVSEALQSARELMATEVLAGSQADGRKFEIMDEAGVIIKVVSFTDALAPPIDQTSETGGS